jgi:hypothetical protein
MARLEIYRPRLDTPKLSQTLHRAETPVAAGFPAFGA